MNIKERFYCPVCSFTIFNRRVPKCERCGTALPASLMFSVEDIAALDEDASKNEAIREEMASKAAEFELEAKRLRQRDAEGGYLN